MARYGKKLTVAFVRTVEKPDIYCDEHGLILRGKPSGYKQRAQRIFIHGRRREFGLGPMPLVTRYPGQGDHAGRPEAGPVRLLIQLDIHSAERRIDAEDGSDARSGAEVLRRRGAKALRRKTGMSLIASLAPGHRLRMSFVGALAVLSMGSAATGVFAAQSDEEPAVLRVGTQLVQVNVVVTGDDGPVHDLTVNDFTVLDDGVERVIEVFDIIRSETAELDPVSILPDGVASNRLDRRGRRPESATVILVDRLNTLGPDQAFMDDQVRAFLDEAAAAVEHVAVLELGEEGLTVLADFTAHPSVIRNALETRRPSHSLAMESSLGFFTGGLDPVLAEAAGETGEEGTDPVSREVARYYMQRRVLLTAAALEASARHLSPLPGRKNLVWIAAQFPFPYKPWQDPRFNIASATNLPPSTLDRIEDVFRVIVDSDVAVYPIHALGLVGLRFSGFGGGPDLASI